MIPPLFSHKCYIRSALAYSRRHGGLRIDHRHYHVWQKLKETNLDHAYPLLATLYSETLVCLGRDPVSMLRSRLAMMLCGVASFTFWVLLAWSLPVSTEPRVNHNRDEQDQTCHRPEDLNRYLHQHQALFQHLQQQYADAGTEYRSVATSEPDTANDTGCHGDQFHTLPPQGIDAQAVGKLHNAG